MQRTITREGEAGYEWAWAKRAPVPGSPAAVLDAAMSDRADFREMSCVADDAGVLPFEARR